MFDPAKYHAAETLSDGRKVEIRAQRPGDPQESPHFSRLEKA